MSRRDAKRRFSAWIPLLVLGAACVFAVERGAPNRAVIGEVVHVDPPKERPQDSFQRARVFNHTIRTQGCQFFWPATQELPHEVGVKLRIGQITGHCYVQAVSLRLPTQ